jgi:four helix bundle protein
MYSFSFEKLEVWQNSKELSILIYKLTKRFPSEEKFGLISQMRRAAISVSSNIAEGTSRKTNRDKAHFTTIAYSSLMELLNQAIISTELKYIQGEEFLEVRERITFIANQLNKLRNFQMKG